MAQVINKTKGFGSIPRDLVYDNELSDRARFLYIFMACKPEGWEFFQDSMCAELGYSKGTLRKYMNELVQRGWIVEDGQENTNGKFGANVYTIEVKIDSIEKLPYNKNTDTVKNRHGKNVTHKNIDNKEINSKEEINKNNNKRETVSDLFPENNEELKFNNWFNESFPTLAKNKRPLKFKTYISLLAKYPKNDIILKLNEMEAKNEFNRKYSDVGRTLWVWLERDYDKAKQRTTNNKTLAK